MNTRNADSTINGELVDGLEATHHFKFNEIQVTSAISGATAQSDPGRIPRRPCSVPGCPELTGNARCEAHQHAHQSEVDAHRGSSSARGYDATWRRLRRAKLATDPVCQIRTNCPGMVATEVDHKTPVRQWPEGRLDWDNLQSTCIPCHRAKTGRERLHRSSKPGGPGGRRVCGQTPSRP